jgi:hypothetical protein
MKKTLTFNNSFRLTLQKQGFGWFNTDPSVKLKDVAALVADQEDQLKAVALGQLEEVDLDAPTHNFWAQSQKGEFLGYVKFRFPTTSSVAQKVWGKLEATPVA